jgi:hypothetical protein
MARLATAADFEGQLPDSLYGGYQKFSFFAYRAAYLDRLWDRLKRAGVLASSLTRAQTKVAVAGSAYGFLVEALVARGFDAWGFDASSYAVGKAQAGAVNLTTRGRVLQKDLLVSSQVTDVRRAAGLTGQNRFHLGVTEDVLPCLSDAEVLQGVGFARSATLALVHIVTAIPPSTPSIVSPLNWMVLADWRTLLSLSNGTCPDWLVNAEGDWSDPAAVAELPPTGWVEPA